MSKGGVRAILAEMLRTSPREAVVGAVLLLVMTFTEGVGLLLLLPLLSLVGVVEENPLPRAANWLDSAFAAVGATPTLGGVLLLFVAIAVVRAVVQRWQLRLNAVVRENLTSSYQLRIYRAMAAAEWRFLSTRTPSDFVNALTNEVGRLGVAANRVTDLAVAAMASLVYFALAMRVAPIISTVALVGAAGLAWTQRGSLFEATVAGAQASEAKSRLHAAVTEHVASLKTARAYGAIDRQTALFHDLTHTSRHVNLEQAAGETHLQQSLELGSTVLLAVIVFVSVEVVDQSPAVLLLVLYVFARLMPRLVSIYRQVQGLASVLPYLEAVTCLERDCLEAAEAVAVHPAPLPPMAKGIGFEDVSFAYLRRASMPAITGLNLHIAAGVTTAIVGPSGSGKSTVADLLLGLLSPTGGRVLVDGEPLTSSTLTAWRRQVSYVSQDTFLFHDTVRANLLWARPDATDADVWDALRLSSADRFVADLPQGIETIIGERGILLSGGERQRLSIARALLRRPSMLVLDEATSSLDAENELRIQRAVDGLQHRMTIVIITHRLSTIRGADVIHVMDGGRVVQSGPWDALQIDLAGRFRQLTLAAGERAPQDAS